MTLVAIGLIMITIGLIILLWPEGKEDTPSKENQHKENIGRIYAKGGAIIMIGPIPIVMGSDRRITILLMLIALAIMIIWFFFLIIK
jgi:uncharacterized protein (TIGR00304 family)